MTETERLLDIQSLMERLAIPEYKEDQKKKRKKYCNPIIKGVPRETYYREYKIKYKKENYSALDPYIRRVTHRANRRRDVEYLDRLRLDIENLDIVKAHSGTIELLKAMLNNG